MVALKRMTEEEAALAAILMDETGVDLSEFAGVDETKPDRCLRLRDYQWRWYTDESKYSISACSRDVGKSHRVIWKALAHVHASPGTDLFLTAPGADHLKPVADAIEEKLLAIRLLQVMLKGGFGKTGIGRIPSFEARFKNGAKIVTRLPKQDGKGSKGQHAKKVIIDEGQDMPELAWDQIWPTMRQDIPGAQTEIYGVTVGSNGTFDQLANDPESAFKLIRKITPERETWSDDERLAAVKKYGGANSIRYHQNIYGRSSGVYSDLLNTARLMSCVLIAQTPWAKEYNDQVYTQFEIDDETLRGSGRKPTDVLVLPPSHREDQYVSYVGGWDVGLVRDASEILVFGQFEQKKRSEYVYRLLTRVSLTGVPAPQQVEVAKWIIDFYGRERFARLSMDRTGNGLPLFQMLDAEPDYQKFVSGYNFSEKIVVGYEDRKPGYKETLKDLEIKQKPPDHGLAILRELVDAGRLELPMITDLLSSWQGIGADHLIDAGRMFGVSVGQLEFEGKAEALKSQAPVKVRFGWS